ncbi:phage head-tail adapter protein [Sphingomonas melonis TY]|uniref:Phage head-tail adapter protein n=1 Tax=Sphingomonas melonis TY TaxID=621456 RepID=A0A175Y0J1_9SPHN|nr:head-tail adaptor protein [Sphingomonas melonis]AOW22228.1 phage head-tail adapter protein [Sphingomonas melonis TY]KZB94098.1 phage head-tail adapter protein [Sphingomonas melonis TY]
MPINAGDLDRRITILRATAADDGLSSVPGEMKTMAQRWANKTDVSDGERMRASEQGQEITSRFLVRDDSVTRTIDGRDMLVCEGRTYAVVGTKEYGGRRVGIEITAIARPDATP